MYRCLTAALLEGEVFSSFKKFKSSYLSPPAGILKLVEKLKDLFLLVLLRPWSTLHSRTTVLIKVFSTLGIDSKKESGFLIDNL